MFLSSSVKSYSNSLSLLISLVAVNIWYSYRWNHLLSISMSLSKFQKCFSCKCVFSILFWRGYKSGKESKTGQRSLVGFEIWCKVTIKKDSFIHQDCIRTNQNNLNWTKGRGDFSVIFAEWKFDLSEMRKGNMRRYFEANSIIKCDKYKEIRTSSRLIKKIFFIRHLSKTGK